METTNNRLLDYDYSQFPNILNDYKELSSDAKILYMKMVQRYKASIRNNMIDKNGRPFIYFTIKSVCEQIGCKTEKACKILKKLETVGLITREKKGLGKADKIYIDESKLQSKPRTTRKSESVSVQPEPTTELPKDETPAKEADNSHLSEHENKKDKIAENRKYGISKNRSMGFRKSKRIIKTEEYIKGDIQSNLSNKRFTYTPNVAPGMEWMMDESDYYNTTDTQGLSERLTETIRKQVDYYDTFLDEYNNSPRVLAYKQKQFLDGIIATMVDLLLSGKQIYRIGGEDISASQIKSSIEHYDSQIMEYLIESLNTCKSKIFNIDAYIKKAIYRAPYTYQTAITTRVNCDLYNYANEYV